MPASFAVSLQIGPANGAPKPVPVEGAQVMPAPARAQTSDFPSPFTSANCTVDAYAAGRHPPPPPASSSVSLHAGPANGAPKPVPDESAQTTPVGSRPQTSA